MAGIAWAVALASPALNAREPVNVTVEFNAPPGCADRDVFASSLMARSNRIQIAQSDLRGWVVSVRLTPKDRGVHGELRLTDDRGESELRAVDGADCAEVVEALSLTAALAIEQIVGADPTEPTSPAPSASVAAPQGLPICVPASEAGTAPQKSSAATGQPKTEVPPPTSHGVGGEATHKRPTHANHLLLQGSVTRRLAAQNSLGIALSFGRRFPILGQLEPELSLGASYIPGNALQPDAALSVKYGGIWLQGCPVHWLPHAVVELSPCALYEFGRLDVEARSLEMSSPSRRWGSTLGLLGRSRFWIQQQNAVEIRLGVARSLAERHYIAEADNLPVGHSATTVWQLGLGWLVGW